ncbi:MAG: cyclophilin-like fold protein [Candidatus Poribacteria bacterium]|nr:cyclophilin-like fold protein [Candidatus Poribacteria bacterium]
MSEKKIKITAEPVVMEAELNQSQTAQQIWDALPIEASGNTWGDEIYFSIPVTMDGENPQEVVDLGDLAYWPPGTAFCIFFGRTPASRGDEIRPASPVNVIGKLSGDPEAFKRVRNGTVVKIEQVEA